MITTRQHTDLFLYSHGDVVESSHAVVNKIEMKHQQLHNEAQNWQIRHNGDRRNCIECCIIKPPIRLRQRTPCHTRDDHLRTNLFNVLLNTSTRVRVEVRKDNYYLVPMPP